MSLPNLPNFSILLNCYRSRQTTVTNPTTPNEFVQYARTMPQYRALRHETDAESADLTVLSIYDSFNRTYIYGGSTLTQGAFRPEEMRDAIGQWIQDEINAVKASKKDIDGLLMECFANIGESLRSRQEYILPAHSYGATNADPDMMKAAKYITGASNSINAANANENQVFIVGAMQEAMNQNYDLRSLDTLYHFNRLFYNVNINQPFRRPHRGEPYPGSGGGLYLHKYTEQLANKLSEGNIYYSPNTLTTHQTPGINATGNNVVLRNRYSNYTNIACFLFGGYLRAHGFTDGNGRTCRFIFACAMLKSGLPFVAPSKLFENRLTGLNPTDHEKNVDNLYDMGIL